MGAALSWSRAFGAHRLLAGTDFRWIDGETDERVYVAGGFARTRVAGGEQQIYGLFVQDVYRPIPMLELVAGIAGTTGAPTRLPARHPAPAASRPPAYSDIDG